MTMHDDRDCVRLARFLDIHRKVPRRFSGAAIQTSCTNDCIGRMLSGITSPIQSAGVKMVESACLSVRAVLNT